MPKPGIDELLIASALDATLLRRLRESPSNVFAEYDLSEGEQDLLRSPDQRLLPLLGAALSRSGVSTASSGSSAPHPIVKSKTLPEVSLVLTVVPCAQEDRVSYAVWVNPIADGVDPATLPPPAGAVLPGQPMAPLYAVVRLSPLKVEGAVALWASLRQASNAETKAVGDTFEDGVRLAAEAVRYATDETRRERLLELARMVEAGVRR